MLLFHIVIGVMLSLLLAFSLIVFLVVLSISKHLLSVFSEKLLTTHSLKFLDVPVGHTFAPTIIAS
jgi:hypothetical protein